MGAQTDPTAHRSVPLLEGGITEMSLSSRMAAQMKFPPTLLVSDLGRTLLPSLQRWARPPPHRQGWTTLMLILRRYRQPPSVRVSPVDSQSPSFSTVQDRPENSEQTATCCNPSEPDTLPTETPLQNPAASLSTQSRARQRISCSDASTLMKPPPPPPRPPPIGGRLGSVSSVRFFSPTQPRSEMTKLSDAPVRSRSAQRMSPQTPRKRLGSGPPMSIFSPAQSASQLSSGRSSLAQRAGPRSGNSAVEDGLFGRRSSFSSDA